MVTTIADGRGKDKLIGGDGADQFTAGEEPFKKKMSIKSSTLIQVRVMPSSSLMRLLVT